MKIKNYKCKVCGSDDFFLGEVSNYKVNAIGIYCNSCGRWLKWASKDERNLMIKQSLNEAYGKDVRI